jgi:short subunit dehydrogenase-like uncharacterized protein
MQLRYDSQAKERGVTIIGSCGFDSLVADLGVETIRRECERDHLSKSSSTASPIDFAFVV